MKDVISKIEKHLESSTDEEEREELRDKGESISFYAKRIVHNCRVFTTEHKAFGSKFVFRKKDYP